MAAAARGKQLYGTKSKEDGQNEDGKPRDPCPPKHGPNPPVPLHCAEDEEKMGTNNYMEYWHCIHCGQRARSKRLLAKSRMWYVQEFTVCSKFGTAEAPRSDSPPPTKTYTANSPDPSGATGSASMSNQPSVVNITNVTAEGLQPGRQMREALTFMQRSIEEFTERMENHNTELQMMTGILEDVQKVVEITQLETTELRQTQNHLVGEMQNIKNALSHMHQVMLTLVTAMNLPVPPGGQ